MHLLLMTDDKGGRRILMMLSSGGTIPRTPRRVRTRVAGLALGASALAITAAALGSAQASAATAAPAAAAKPADGAGSAATFTYTPPTRVLKQGMTGRDVLALQYRLAGLKYWVPAFDGTFGYDTTETLYAFQAVNGLKMTGIVDAATAKALVNPRSYTPRDTRVATRIEVDINTNKQLLVYYKNHNLALISHISSGRVDHAWTPTGTYTANIYIPGWIQVPLGYMYNSVFFTVNGRTLVYAIHGDTVVPNYPDSHGCIRIPIDLAKVFHSMIDIRDVNGFGTQIYIYGTNWHTGY